MKTILKIGSGVLKKITNNKEQKGIVIVYLDGIEIFRKKLAREFEQVFWEDGYRFTAFLNGKPIVPPEALPSLYQEKLEIETTGDINVLYT